MHEGELWTDEELRIAVEAYLFILRLQQAGVNYEHSDLFGLLRQGPLARRNDSSIRYRMRNISAVLISRGNPTLKAFSPAPKLGGGVQARIESMLPARAEMDALLIAETTLRPPDLASAQSKIETAERALKEALEALHREDSGLAGIGHNQPPESLESGALTADDLRNAITVLGTLRDDVATGRLSAAKAEEEVTFLTTFGVRAAAWVGKRITKATDIALATAVPIAVVTLANALPPVANAIGALVRLLPHLL